MDFYQWRQLLRISKYWVTARESPHLMQLTSLALKKEQLPHSLYIFSYTRAIILRHKHYLHPNFRKKGSSFVAKVNEEDIYDYPTVRRGGVTKLQLSKRLHIR